MAVLRRRGYTVRFEEYVFSTAAVGLVYTTGVGEMRRLVRASGRCVEK